MFVKQINRHFITLSLSFLVLFLSVSGVSVAEATYKIDPKYPQFCSISPDGTTYTFSEFETLLSRHNRSQNRQCTRAISMTDNGTMKVTSQIDITGKAANDLKGGLTGGVVIAGQIARVQVVFDAKGLGDCPILVNPDSLTIRDKDGNSITADKNIQIDNILIKVDNADKAFCNKKDNSALYVKKLVSGSRYSAEQTVDQKKLLEIHRQVFIDGPTGGSSPAPKPTPTPNSKKWPAPTCLIGMEGPIEGRYLISWNAYGYSSSVALKRSFEVNSSTYTDTIDTRPIGLKWVTPLTKTTYFVTAVGRWKGSCSSKSIIIDPRQTTTPPPFLNDKDKDGVADSTDNCITVSNSDQKDTDGDKIGDACDPDIDNDKVLNADDPNPYKTDADGDGLNDFDDPCPLDKTLKAKHEGKCQAKPSDVAANQDSDGDGLTDILEKTLKTDPNKSDTDGDGFSDSTDCFPLDKTKNSCKSGSILKLPDTDGDGYCDKDETVLDPITQKNCKPKDNCPFTANADQKDSNGNGIGDACEASTAISKTDGDADGVPDNLEKAWGLDPKKLDTDGDGCSDGEEVNGKTGIAGAGNPDIDADGWCDCGTEVTGVCKVPATTKSKGDNCPLVSNVDQKDTDGDGTGDACQDDDDGDGVKNSTDNCPFVKNKDQDDQDKDGIGDSCDFDAVASLSFSGGGGGCSLIQN